MKKAIYSILMTLCCLAVAATAQAVTFTFKISNVTYKTSPDATYCSPMQIKVINNGVAVITKGSKHMEPGTTETITTSDVSACTSIELSTNCGWTRPSLTTGCASGQIAIVTPYAMIQL